MFEKTYQIDPERERPVKREKSPEDYYMLLQLANSPVTLQLQDDFDKQQSERYEKSQSQSAKRKPKKDHSQSNKSAKKSLQKKL